MKKTKKILGLVMALCITVLVSSCIKPRKGDIDLHGLESAVENAVQNHSEDVIREVPEYSGENESIRDMCTILKSDSLDEDMKKSSLYNMMCDIIENDRYSATIPEDDGIEAEVNVSGADWLCIMQGNGQNVAIMKNSKDIYYIDYDNRQYMSFSILTSLFQIPESEFKEKFEDLPNLLSVFNGLSDYEFAGSGSETFNGVEYYYEDFRKKESSETKRCYYIDGKCIGPVESGMGLDSASGFSPSLINDIKIPSGYTEITWDNMFDGMFDSMFE